MYDQEKRKIPQNTHFQVSTNQTNHVFIELINFRLSVWSYFSHTQVYLSEHIFWNKITSFRSLLYYNLHTL